MVVTPSLMVPIGTKAPNFELPSTDGQTVRLSDFDGKPLLVIFQCNHCPYVKHVREKLAQLTKGYIEKGVAVVGISSNDAEQYPDDGPEAMKEEKALIGYPYPYLYDETQEVAKAYKATCTPDFFLFDKDHKLAYRGQMDESRPKSEKPVTGADLTRAVEAVLKGEEIPAEAQKPSAGCNIKWKPGNEPDYFK
jgi:peroxiredoxin